jgi:uncharacterized membrane protein
LERNDTLSKASLIRYKILKTLTFIIGNLIILVCFHFSNVPHNTPIVIGSLIGSLLGTISRNPVRRNKRIDQIMIVPFIMLFCVIVFVTSEADISKKVIYSVIIIITLLVCEVIENKLLGKILKENSN